MIVLYVGRRGSGKTTSLVKDGLQYKANGWYIVTNMETLDFADLALTNEEILTLLDNPLRDYILIIDEIQTFIDSRRSMRKENVNFTYFLQQIRKRNVIILATTQFSGRVDVAFREHMDVIAAPEFNHEHGVIRIRYFDNTYSEGFFQDDRRLPFRDVVFDPRGVFEHFDTEEVISGKKEKHKQND